MSHQQFFDFNRVITHSTLGSLALSQNYRLIQSFLKIYYVLLCYNGLPKTAQNFICFVDFSSILLNRVINSKVK